MIVSALVIATVMAVPESPDSEATRTFSYEEHCLVGNDALTLALRRLGPDHRFADLLRGSLSTACRAAGDISYGDMVALGDAALSATDYFAGVRNDAAWWQHQTGQVPRRALLGLREDILNLARATHLNEQHFQDKALFSFFTWHQNAVEIAARRGDPTVALVLNAYADHFIQDILAPGHVFAPRRGVHDATALATHDRFNAEGIDFYLRDAAGLAQLAPDVPLRLGAGRFPSRTELTARLDSLGDAPVTFLGDGDLWDERTRDTSLPRMLMTLITARSVLDVLQSADRRSVVNSFESYEWRGYQRSGGGSTRVTSPAWSFPYGEVRSVDMTTSLPAEPVIGLEVGFETMGFPGQADHLRLSLGLAWLAWTHQGTKWLEDTGGEGERDPVVPGWGLALGASWTNTAGDWAGGPQAELIAPVPYVDMHFRLETGVRRHDGDWRPRAGLRMDLGFGFVFYSIGWALEHVEAPAEHAGWRPVLSARFTGQPPARLFRFW